MLSITAPTDLTSLLAFLWLAVTMGLLSLLTPCILPMIPVTVSYFGAAGKHPARTRSLAALAHAVGIVGMFALLGLGVTTLLGAGGMVRLAANPVLNLLIAALFIAFALNLLGAFEITLPQRLLTRAATVGTSGHRHAAGALLMGGAFAITSFTCTVPFVGTLLVLATQGSWRWPLVGLTAYGAAFALPFFLLALSPRLLERIPRSGDWMLTLKRGLAVAEIALAVKFLSNADLVLGTNLLTRDVVIVVWILAAFAIAGLAASRIFPPSPRSPIRDDSGSFGQFGSSHSGSFGQFGSSSFQAPPRRAIPAIAIAMSALGLALWLGKGLRGERLGELEAYLPPHLDSAGVAVFANASNGELPWMVNAYDSALAIARAENKPLLVDFTGYTCTNCRWMEANMFPRTDVVPQLERFVRVRLYTDGIGQPYLGQQTFQFERFGTIALPYYAVIDPSGIPRATFLGMTRDSKEFARFLSSASGTPPVLAKD